VSRGLVSKGKRCGARDHRGSALVIQIRKEQTMETHTTGQQSFAIILPEYSQNELIDLACKHYNERTPELAPATPGSHRSFLKRICVNYLRHQCTNYDRGLSDIFKNRTTIGKKKIGLAVFQHTAAIFTAITLQYPWLKGECNRQFNPMKMKMENAQRRREKRAAKLGMAVAA